MVDDCSTDNSDEVIRNYAKGDPRIKPIFLAKNGGAVAAFNCGFSLAIGELFYGSAADDFISNNKFFEIAVNKLRIRPDAAGVVFKTRVVEASTSEPLWDMGGGWHGYISPENSIKAFFNGEMFIPGSSAIWRTDLVKHVGFHEDLGPQSDYFVNHALPALNGAFFINAVSTIMRKSDATYSAQSSHLDYFARHALVERRLKQICKFRNVNNKKIDEWRLRIIDGRLSLTRQDKFIAMIHDFYSRIEGWEKDGLSERFLECQRYLIAELALLKLELENSKIEAMAVFKEINIDESIEGERS